MLLEHIMADAAPEEPKEEEADRSIRVAADLADMLGWVDHFQKKLPKRERKTIAQLVDPFLREEVVELFAPYKQDAIRIAKAMGQVVRPGQVPRPPKRG